MADVYVVLDLDYDSTGVVGVFLDLAAAERFVQAAGAADKTRVFSIQHWHVAGSTSKLVEPKDGK